MRHAASGFFAGLHASAANVCTNLAMLMHAGVLFALVRANPACRRAYMKHATDHLLVEPGPARRESARDVADIGAIEVEPDALGERLDLFFREASIRAGGASLRARIAFFNAPDQQMISLAAYVWMRADHFLGLHRDISGSIAPFFPSVRPRKSSAAQRKNFVRSGTKSRRTAPPCC
jgi:hypothetical protein